MTPKGHSVLLLTIALVLCDTLFCAAQVGGSLKLAHETLPEYPKEARKHKIQGPVKLRLKVAADGTVSQVAVVSGKPELVEVASSSAATRKYEPLTQAADFQLTTVVYFALTGAGPLTFSIDDPPDDLQFANGMDSGVTAPVLMQGLDPEYTDQARRDWKQGTCVLSAVVGKDGQTYNITPLVKLGDGLDERAIEAVKKWKFKAATKNRQPVSFLVVVDVVFRLMK